MGEPTGWVAFFCTEPSATVAEILTTAGDRFALETAFRDCKEVVGVGQQPVRSFWANIGAFQVCLWTFTMTKASAWRRSVEELVGPQTSPWDHPNRRPSPADKRRPWRRESLAEEIQAVLRPEATHAEIQAAAGRLRNLAASE